MCFAQQIALRNTEAIRIAEVIADRLVETVPEEFNVTVTNGVIGVLGTGKWRGNSFRSRPANIWLLPLSTERRLEIIFDSYSKDLQSFLSRMRGTAWPSSGAKAHVSFAADTIDVWWGGPQQSEAVIGLRPISRGDLGV